MVMIENDLPAILSEVLDENAVCTFEQLCVSCVVESDWVAELVEHGAIELIGRTRGETRTGWQFASLSIVRVAKAKRLQRDLSLNPPGIALALDLLDQIEQLRSQLASIEGATIEPGKK